MIAAAVGGLIASFLLFALSRRRALDVAHEVRRPLTALLLTAESLRPHLREGELDALAREVRRASEKLNDLDWLTSTVRQVFWDDIGAKPKISSVVREVALAWEPVARAQGRRITVEDRASNRLSCDGERLGRALSNLISNALEHGSGDVCVAASDRGGTCRISVANGAGRNDDHAASSRSLFIPPALTGSARRGRGLRIAAFEVRRLGGLLRGWDEARGTAELVLASGEAQQ